MQEAAEAFEPVVQAYDVLRDPVARAVYDKDGVAGVHLLRNRLVVRPYSTVDAVKNRVDRILKQQAQVGCRSPRLFVLWLCAFGYI